MTLAERLRLAAECADLTAHDLNTNRFDELIKLAEEAAPLLSEVERLREERADVLQFLDAIIEASCGRRYCGCCDMDATLARNARRALGGS